jgi:light-regulated signal transduction histidine kinase (bacteriophytochrome)
LAAAAWRAVASGLLTVRLTDADRILWFRPEVVAEVQWAGDPYKPSTTARRIGSSSGIC